MKALIVDDETDICYLLGGILNNKNVDNTYVNTLAEAELAIDSDQPGILFLDNHLPDGFGIDYIPLVKKRFPQIKVIMLTAYDTAIEKRDALRSGADYFLGKPFSKSSISIILDEIEHG